MAGATAAPAAGQGLPQLPQLPGGGSGGGQQPTGGGNPPPQQRPPDSRPQPASQGVEPAPVSPAPGSVTDGVDVAHTGFFGELDLVPPLVARWNVAVAARQVLAADTRVYVLVDGGVAALDQATGRQLWAAALAVPPSGAGYDGGAVYVGTGDEVVALDATSGGVRWRKALGPGARPGAPVATGGAVYATRAAGDVVHALRASDGAELWNKPVPAGAETAAIDNGRMFLAGVCGGAIALNRADGSTAWKRDGGCAGPGEVTPALASGRLYVPSDGSILDAGAGGAAGRFAGARPVFVDGLAVHAAPGAVTAIGAGGRQAWRSTGGLDSPLAVGHDVFGFRANRLTVLGSEDGRVLWSDGRAVSPNGRLLAVAPGMLLVAGDGRLVAYQSALRAQPRGIAVGAETDEVAAGSTFSLVGVLGRELRRDGARVRVFGADWPRGRFARVSDQRASRDGGFLAAVTLFRSSRFRVRSGTGRSDEVTVYALPRVQLGRPRSARGGRMSVVARVRTPRTRLGGLRFHLYLRRAATRRHERVASGRLRNAGAGRTRARLVFPRLKRTTKDDTLAFCIQRQLRLGLGKPSPLTRRCGAKRLPA